jgi:quercetin dioxygenase-like cupin family protein
VFRLLCIRHFIDVHQSEDADSPVALTQNQFNLEVVMSNGQSNLVGQALTLNELVSYQDDAVVSKTLVARKGVGTITLFSFAAGQGLSEHTAPFDAVVEIVDGEAEITIDGVAQTVVAGQLLIMPANHPHSLQAVKPFKMLLVMIRG